MQANSSRVVTRIEANPLLSRTSTEFVKKKVAAYCRVSTDSEDQLVCYDIHDLGKQLMPIGMLVVLDNILNRITANKEKGRRTYIFIDEIYLLFKHEYSANFLFTLWNEVMSHARHQNEGFTQNHQDLS